jgi:hypothetical protein
LAANAAPVRRVRPLARASLWIAIAALILALLGIGQGFRPDLAERLRQPSFSIAIAASSLTGILAVLTASFLSLPDRPRAWSLLPLPALVLWVATIGYGCVASWVGLAPGGITPAEVARCFATLLLTSVPLSAALLLLLRHAALVRPGAVVLCGSLGVAGMTATALSLFHNLDATIMVVIWNLGTTAAVVGLAGAFGRKMLRMVAPRTSAARDQMRQDRS